MESTPIFLPGELHEQNENATRYDAIRWAPYPHPSPRLESVQYVTGEEWRAITNSSSKNEATVPKLKRRLDVWMCLVLKVKSDAIKNNIE